ncbi:hypothetical protein KQI65_09215 [bacterium]|nr:hypothetical protein [bacterium]
MKQQHRDDDIERTVRQLPKHTPDDALWSRIEKSLREEQRNAAATPESGLLQRLAQTFSIPAKTLLFYTVTILVGVAMSWYLLGEYTRHDTEVPVAQSRDAMLLDAQSDIEQAIFYYERAIGKLAVLAEESEDNLHPEFVELQKKKIALLRESIAECKTALKKNGANPEVQHYLLAAYTDLQHTLQAMVTRAQ